MPSKAETTGPVGNIWRVDVAGYSCYVRGEEAMRHLECVNRQMARMKLALHRIRQMEAFEFDQREVAAEALKNV